MTESERRIFRQEVDRFTDDVRRRALELFDRGLPPGRALRFAVDTAAALAAHRATTALAQAMIDERRRES